MRIEISRPWVRRLLAINLNYRLIWMVTGSISGLTCFKGGLSLYTLGSQMYEGTGVNLLASMKLLGFGILFLSLTAALVACSGEARKAELTEANIKAQADEERSGAPALRLLNGRGDRFTLEIRALGLNIDGASQDEIWKPFSGVKTVASSVLTRRPEDYPADRAGRLMQHRIAGELTAKNVGLDAVSDWPLPSFSAQPASLPKAKSRAGESITPALVSAGMVYTYAIWVDDINGEDASPIVDKLFSFFDANPEVPQAMLMVRDGDVVREFMKGSDAVWIDGPYVPNRPLAMVSFLVSRSDRVNRAIRPYAIEEKSSAKLPSQTEFDYIKLYNFYWSVNETYLRGMSGKYLTSTISAEYWAARLPSFFSTIDTSGDGKFKRTAYLPLRWTSWQLKHFDEAPVMGYLHRPITVSLNDAAGDPLHGKELIAAIGAGWLRAVGTLPVGELPQRIFRDTRNDRGLTGTLGLVLQKQPNPLDWDNLQQGYDIGVRIGDTGISSPFVQLALATMASYKLGGASATVHRRENGDLTFTMISPPDEEKKAQWEGKNKRNPFYAHVH